jgi:hypothetical protein
MDKLQQGIERTLNRFVDAWVEGDYDRATAEGLLASAALKQLEGRASQKTSHPKRRNADA